MAAMRPVAARVPEDLEAEARARAPELAYLPLSVLLRVGLAVLAGNKLDDAIARSLSYRQPPGPRPDKAVA